MANAKDAARKGPAALEADDWLTEDVQVATPENDPNVHDPLQRRRSPYFNPPWSNCGSADLGFVDRGRSGAAASRPRMSRVKQEMFRCPPMTSLQVPFNECQLEEPEEELCPLEESEEVEEEEMEICARPKCSGAKAQRNEFMSMPSNLILSKPPPLNPPIGVYPGPRPRALRLRLLEEMGNVCAVYEKFKTDRRGLVELGEADDLHESVRCLEQDVTQIESIRDSLKTVNEAICNELKISSRFASSKLGAGGLVARQVLSAQRKQVAEVREDRLARLREAIETLSASDKLTEEAFEAVKLLQKCPEECAEEQRRTALALTLDLLKVADDSFCKAVTSIDWILASFCAKEAVAGNIIRAITEFIHSSDDRNPRLLQMFKLTETEEKLVLAGLLEGEKTTLLKTLRKARTCLLRARDEFIGKFQPIPPVKPLKSDYPRGSSRRASSSSPSPPTAKRTTAGPSSLAPEREIRCLRREDENEILKPTTIRNVKRYGIA